MKSLRLVAAVLLVLGIVVVGLYFPAKREISWAGIQSTRFDSELCRQLKGEKEITQFRWPESSEAPITISEVARRWGVELQSICALNNLGPSCGVDYLQPGQSIELNLAPSDPGSSPPALPVAEEGGEP